MARITVEDCIDKFPSRFELVLVASNRARKLHAGDNPTVDVDNDKNTVIALREIAEETLKTDQLKNDLIEEYQTNNFSEDEDLDEIENNSNESQDEVNESINNELHQYKEIDNSVEDRPIENSEDNLENSEENSENSSDEDKVQDL